MGAVKVNFVTDAVSDMTDHRDRSSQQMHINLAIATSHQIVLSATS